jgi:ribosome-associated translation inhibitor RaiA
MQTPLQLTFRHLDPSAAVEERVRELVTHLERFHDRITGCHVVIEAPPAHRNKGAPFDVKVDLIVPGSRISVRSDRAEHPTHADVYVALRDAFDAAKRALKDHADRQR